MKQKLVELKGKTDKFNTDRITLLITDRTSRQKPEI